MAIHIIGFLIKEEPVQGMPMIPALGGWGRKIRISRLVLAIGDLSQTIKQKEKG